MIPKCLSPGSYFNPPALLAFFKQRYSIPDGFLVLLVGPGRVLHLLPDFTRQLAAFSAVAVLFGVHTGINRTNFRSQVFGPVDLAFDGPAFPLAFLI
jgi:hypothetical protein